MQQLIVPRGGKTPTPKISALVRKRPVLLRANFVLTKDRKRPYYRQFCDKIHREGSCSKAAGVLSKVQMLNLVLGVGVFSPLPIIVQNLSAEKSRHVPETSARNMSLEGHIKTCAEEIV